MENQKLGQCPAFPNGLDSGITQRFYAARGYADAAYKWADSLTLKDGRQLIGISPDVEWIYAIHFPMLVIKLQYILADELLKQENE